MVRAPVGEALHGSRCALYLLTAYSPLFRLALAANSGGTNWEAKCREGTSSNMYLTGQALYLDH